MLFPEEIPFDPAEPGAALASLPERPAVFALRGDAGEPYLNRTANLRARLTRLLTPAPVHSKRLQLAALVRRIAWAPTASDFAADMLLFRASSAVFGDLAAKRMRLHVPFFVRMGTGNRFPRLWVTNSIAARTGGDLFGPFPSRNAAERYAEGVLDLHLLRRCFPDLDPDPEFPGCIYSEMKKCLAPCFGGCSDERYHAEATAVHDFLRARGASSLRLLAAERDMASEALDFEAASAAHARLLKMETVQSYAPELAGALAAQSGVVVQASVTPDQVELFGLRRGVLSGPLSFSMLGLRLHNEQGGSTSLFAHPAVLRPVALENTARSGPGPEDRLREVLLSLEEQQLSSHDRELGAHQALLARWYFRPQTKREGELVLAEDGHLSEKAVMRACSRVYRAYVERHPPAVPE